MENTDENSWEPWLEETPKPKMDNTDEIDLEPLSEKISEPKMDNPAEISLESFVASHKERFTKYTEERLARELNHVKKLIAKASPKEPHIDVGYELHDKTIGIFRKSGVQLISNEHDKRYILRFISDWKNKCNTFVNKNTNGR